MSPTKNITDTCMVRIEISKRQFQKIAYRFCDFFILAFLVFGEQLLFEKIFDSSHLHNCCCVAFWIVRLVYSRGQIQPNVHVDKEILRWNLKPMVSENLHTSTPPRPSVLPQLFLRLHVGLYDIGYIAYCLMSSPLIGIPVPALFCFHSWCQIYTNITDPLLFNVYSQRNLLQAKKTHLPDPNYIDFLLTVNNRP